MTTSACNFQCVYCFEEASRCEEHMTMETAEEVIGWIRRKAKEGNYRKISLVFYGGEPLLNKLVLERIMIQMCRWCRSQKIDFEFMLQTNGYLVTPELIDQYKPFGLKSCRISLDGVKEDHDQNRPLRGGGGTFDRIMENIRICADKIPIGLSVSYRDDSVEHIRRLLDYLEQEEVLHKLDRFMFSPLHPALGGQDNPEAIRHSECFCGYDDKLLIKANRAIRAMLEQKNISSGRGLTVTVCPLTREHGSATIDQKGNIFRCNSFLGHPEFAVGNVSDAQPYPAYEKFMNLNIWEKCPADCPYLPVCCGGCRLASFLKHKDFSNIICHREYLDDMAPDLIKKEYDLLSSGS